MYTIDLNLDPSLVGVLVDAVGLPIDLMDVIGVFVDPWASGSS